MTDSGRGLAELTRQFDALSAELARMPAFKRGTYWHISRVRGRHQLGRQIDRLAGVPPVPTGCRPAARDGYPV